MQENKLELSDKALIQIESIFDYPEGVRKGKGADFLEVLWDCLEAELRCIMVLCDTNIFIHAFNGNPDKLVQMKIGLLMA